MRQPTFKNKLIHNLSAEDFDHLGRHFEPVSLTFREHLIQANKPVSHVYFPESGQCSMLARVPHSEPIEVGMFGVEGMSEMAPDGRTPFDTIVQVAGDAHRVDFQLFLDAALNSSTLTETTNRYQQAMLVQLSYTTLSHGSFTATERLARWILMTHDRVDGDELPLVHEFFSWMLAVRRAGITDALKELRSHGAIDTGRGRVVVLDRDELIALASGSYGPAEAEFQRLLGASLPKWSGEGARAHGFE